jgi:signal transduction histidine kinase
MSVTKARKSVQHRFESEVHIGLLLIIFVLLFVAFASNLFIYKARVRLTDQWTARLESTSILIHRQLSHYFPAVVPDSAITAVCSRYDLTDLFVTAAGPGENTEQAKRRWLAEVAGTVPPAKIAMLAERLFGSDERALTQQTDGSYLFIVAGEKAQGSSYMMLSVRIPELAYFDRASSWILAASCIAVLLIGGLYFYLARFIFRPFRKIRMEAERAGRPIADAGNEAEAVAIEYQRIIDDLHANQEELLRLNAEVKRRADSLEQVNEYILKSTQSGALTIDMSGRILAINATAVQLLGLSAMPNASIDYRDLLSENHPLRMTIAVALASAQSPAYEEQKWGGATVGVSSSFVKNDDNQSVGLWLLLFDLSETTALRKELEDRRRLAALGEMAGGLAHQLRNSIGAISGYARLLKKKTGESPESTTHADSLLAETQQADQLVRRFLSFSRPLECELVPCILSVLISEIADGMRVRPDFAGIKLTIRRDSCSDARAQVDPLLFKQVLSNLIENASQSYADRSGDIEVSITASSTEIVIEVRDRGCGIPLDKVDKVFTPFYSGRPGGTGLGLSLAARIIEMHKGVLSLSPNPGGGTIAAIKLPASTPVPGVNTTTDSVASR